MSRIRTLPPDFSFLNQLQQKRPRMSVESFMSRYELEESQLTPDDLVDQEEEEEEEEEFENDVSESILDNSVYEIDEEIIEEEEEEEPEEFANNVSESVLDEEVIEEEDEGEEFVNDVSEFEGDMSVETTMESGNYGISEYDIHLINEGQQQQGLNPTSGTVRARMTPRMRVITNYVRHTIQVPQLVEEEIEEEEVEDDINEFMDQDMAEYLESRTYHAPLAMDNEEQEACAICLLEYQDGDTIGTLQCSYEFHVECIQKWLQRKKACPCCRASVLPTSLFESFSCSL